MTFNEENTVENYMKDLLSKNGWTYVSPKELPRQENEVLIEEHIKEALINLNPEIKENPELAEEVLYKLRAIIISVRGTGLVKTNEELSKWIRNQKTMPFGENGEHTTVKLIDFEDIKNNKFIVTTQYSYSAGVNKRPDLVLLVNGIPLIIGEIKTPTRPSVSWEDGASDMEAYHESVPHLFVPNLFCFATEGKSFRVGSIKLPLEKWQPWRKTTDTKFEILKEVENAVELLLKPETVLDILENFTLYGTAKGGVKIKLMCRYQQYEATKQIIERVKYGKTKKGLIWHFQGSGKSLLMVYAAMQLRKSPELKSPTIVVVVDRIDLDSQISATFNASSVPNVVTTDSRKELKRLLKQDTRKIIITTIHKFAEADDALNERENIIVLVDEAHRTQEGDLGRKMRNSLPNAFLFGLTGTPINKRDKNTFATFGADEDKTGYLSRYSFEQSIIDKATLPIDFEPRLVDLHVNHAEIDRLFHEMADRNQLDEPDMIEITKQAAKFGVLVKSKDRLEKICEDIAKHFKTHIDPSGFKGQVVTFDRESCHLYKQELDKHLASEESAVIMTLTKGDPESWKKNYSLTKDDQEKLIERFNEPSDPLKLLIVTAKLLTGFDAPINKVMYLDKPMKGHNLLQAVCRVNRLYPNKNRGLIVDYLGVFDKVTDALDFDLNEMKKVVNNIQELKNEIPKAIQNCLSHFKDIDRKIEGYEGLLLAQDCLPTKELKDQFAADYSYLSRHWESVSPDLILNDYETDYKWLSQIYESLRPPSGNGKLLWHTLGPKTIELIHKNVTVDAIRDDLENLELNVGVLEKISEKNKDKKIKELEIKITWKLHKKINDPIFRELGLRLEELRDRHQKNAISSLGYLKGLLDLAKDTVKAERETDTEPIDDTKEALTKLFLESKIEKTPKIIEQIVNDIDSVVKVTRFDGWQWTNRGEREIQKALRQVLLKVKLHKEQELFDKAYDYLRQHY